MNRLAPRRIILTLLIVLLITGSSPVLALPLADEAAPGQEDMDALQAFWLESYGSSSRYAQFGGPSFPLDVELLAKAEPDECYDGIGQPYPPGPACATGREKVNQA